MTSKAPLLTLRSQLTNDPFLRPVWLVVAFFLLGASATGPAVAQPTWVESPSGYDESVTSRPQVSLQWTRPSFDSNDLAGEVSTSTLTSRLVVAGQYPISPRTRLVADLPIGHFGIDDEDAGEADGTSSTEVGNPYLGVHTRYGDGSSLAEGWAAGAGVRLPLASMPDEAETPEEFRQGLVDLLALLTSSISDLSRVEAFLPDTFTARGYGGYTARSGEGLAGRLRTGLSLLVPTENGDERDNIVLFDYGGRAWYDGDPLRVGFGLGGRTNLNTDEEGINIENLDERSRFYLDAALQAQFDQVRPGLILRVPLSEEASDALDYAAGVSLTVTL